MGLRSAKHGVKSELKARFPSAFKEFANLAEARDASQAVRKDTVSLLDGNVLMMSVPQGASTLDAYVAILTSNLKRAIATSFLTVVVFDEPDFMTEAKIQEQMKRDANRASNTAVICSSDIVPQHPVNDDYDKEYLQQAQGVNLLVQNRATRHRFFDEVSRTVMEKLTSQIERWNNSGFEGGHVVFDGVDSRGADRPKGEKRVIGMVGSCERIVSMLKRDTPIGEGDLKLAQLGRRVRFLSETNEQDFESIKLSLCTTIDTDSFAIELIEEAKRDVDKKKKPFNSLLCMRERARKRGMDDDKESVYLCCDVSLLHALLQRHIWGPHRSPTQSDSQAAMTLLVGGWALCGCDFTELKGMRSDLVFDAIPVVAKTAPQAIEAAKFAWTGNRDDVFKLDMPIRALSMHCASLLSELPRVKKNVVPSIRNPDDWIVRRTAWVMSYWNSVEFSGNMEDFGFFRPFSDE
jgi:hypothetical protein